MDKMLIKKNLYDVNKKPAMILKELKESVNKSNAFCTQLPPPPMHLELSFRWRSQQKVAGVRVFS
jgi:hypothetical protein